MLRAAINTAAKKERLHSWKEIADYLGRGVRTVQRWEREEGLPVHRLTHQKTATVFALVAEVDAWLHRHADLLEKPEPSTEQKTKSRFSFVQFAAGMTLLGVGIVSAFWLLRARPQAETALRVTPLTSYPGVESQPAFSPDGNRVAFTWRGGIYVKTLGVDTPRRLTAAHGFLPAWSRDGRWIAFCRQGPGRLDHSIVLVPAAGGAERPMGVTVRPPLDVPRPYLTFSHDGKWLIVMDASTSTGYSALVAMSIESGEKRQLTAPPLGFSDSAPALSPDGRTLAFSRGNLGGGNIFLLSLTPEVEAAREPRQLTFEKRAIGNPVWSGDGREIIFGFRSDVTPGLYRIPVDGGGASQYISGTGMVFTDLAISPRGERLAYTTHFREMHIWRTPLSSEYRTADEPKSAFIHSTRRDWYPRYSPDGTRIAFASTRSGTDELFVCRSDGSDVRQLTSLGGLYAGTPSWSPDGMSIAFTSAVEGGADLFVVPAAGGEARRLTWHPAGDQSPNWSPDGKWIYFASDRGGQWQAWKIPAEGGQAVRITRNGGAYLRLSPDGLSLYFGAGWGEWNVWRASVQGGDEEQIIGSIALPGAFTVVNDGIYYFPGQTPAPRPGRKRSSGPGSPDLYFYRFATGKSEWVSEGFGRWPMFIDHSPDRKHLLSTIAVGHPGDIMLVEGFR